MSRRKRQTRRAPGTGSVQSRNTRHGIVYDATPPRDAAGSRGEKKTFDTYEAANAYCLEMAEKVRGGRTYTVSTSLDEYAAGFLTGKETSVKTNTLDYYRRNLKNHILPALGRLGLKSLDVPRLKKWKVDMLAAGHGVHVVRAAMCTLSVVLGEAVNDGILTENPLTRVERPRIPKNPAQPGRREIVWDENDLSGFLIAAQGHRLYNLFYLLAATGMRRGEALALRRSSLDFAGPRIKIDATIVEPDAGGWEFGTTKSDYSLRTIDVDGAVMDALRQQLEQTDRQRLLMGKRWKEHDLVFTTTVGTPVPGYEVDREFTKLVQAAGLPGIVLHGLRHSFISNALDEGYAPKTVAEYVGDRVETILAHYTHRTGRGSALARFGGGLVQLISVGPEKGKE